MKIIFIDQQIVITVMTSINSTRYLYFRILRFTTGIYFKTIKICGLEVLYLPYINSKWKAAVHLRIHTTIPHGRYVDVHPDGHVQLNYDKKVRVIIAHVYWVTQNCVRNANNVHDSKC